jgi:NAD(P)-dependent dehydrogenase (short-subunit alcohol dehydrogenase family)
MPRYSAVHKNPSGPGDARPTAMQIIKDESLENGLLDKVIFLVGASAGIGVETGRALAATGAQLFLGARNVEKAKQACSDFLSPGRVEVVQIDTSSFASVRKAAAEVLSKTDKLHVLVNNGAIMMCPEDKSEDGFELQLATNYLGPFLLYKLLEEKLLESATSQWPSRVINVSSSAHHSSGVHFSNINLIGEYDALKAYGQSKIAMIYMTNEIDRLYGPRHLHAMSVMPGGIMTNLQQHFSEETKAGWEKNEEVQKILKSVEQGAATTVIAAVGREWQGKGGKYLEDCEEAVTFEVPPPYGARGYAKHAYDKEQEERLWYESHKWVGLPAPAT